MTLLYGFIDDASGGQVIMAASRGCGSQLIMWRRYSLRTSQTAHPWDAYSKEPLISVDVISVGQPVVPTLTCEFIFSHIYVHKCYNTGHLMHLV